jgi:2-polyprenyl-3-methyl-5-hydroxy-6-metoxy-1,4-benzoquinol methylase
LELEILKNCDLCGGETHDILFVKEGFPHVRCRGCRLVFVNPRLAAHLEMQVRSGTGSMGEDSLTVPQRRRLRRELTSLEPFRKLNRVLEVGAGRGWFLQEAANMGWETWAVEINGDALRHLQSKGIYRIITQPAEEFDAEVQVDAVRMWDVIEHLRSPRQALAKIRRVLRPSGLLRLSTTNYNCLSRWVNGPEWVYLNGSDHILLFEPPTIERLLAENGFANIQIRTRDFNMKRKLYHPERDLPSRWLVLKPFRKLLDECMRFTRYGHQMIVTAVRAP